MSGATFTASQVLRGIGTGFWYSRVHLFKSYCVIPVGILILFTILYGLNQLLVNVIKIKFPSSVLGMLINLIFLCVVNALAAGTSGKVSHWAAWVLDHYMRIIKPSMNFSLKWINVFFIPSFIILPLSKHITFIECLKIAAVFAIGWIILMLIDVYFILGLKYALMSLSLFTPEEAHKNDDTELLDLRKKSSQEDTNDGGFTSMRDDITTIDTNLQRHSKTRSLSINENPFNTQEEIPRPSVERPAPTYQNSPRCQHTDFSTPNSRQSTPSDLATSISVPLPETSTPPSATPPPSSISEYENSPVEQKITIFITSYIDWIVYLFLFVVSIPFYYIKSIHTFLPYHLGLTIVSYYIALLIPQRWPASKKFAHPILVLTAEILFVCFIGSLIFHSGSPKGFLDDLRFYKTGKNYLNLFNNKVLIDNGSQHLIPVEDYTSTPKWPGCGDVLSSLMDISIVSLSLPMFTHRKDFVKNFWVLMPPILVSIALTFFIYPIVCYNIGIAPERSIGFIGRSVTLALGTPLINNLEGSVSLMAVCTILSGICGVLIGDHFFALLRVSKNDYVTRGVSLGINCGAIATAHLLNTDPRAASMSSLSFSLFGTVMIILASIGAIRDEIRSLVGLA
ncbi:uncharacterized protein CANTADRAFT_4319 [Suhomyces tanzawaensis NRRL Y-17324]|uniref:LrgB-domain-containing protein n=1 Tax=Suhomyces tanzawaensis NRRL Y-17324 TaxID=984487 RepID=A0A1E4SS21_9ASCO|nr:uncharacterized protein CANTADRAFT_4319 [Suhomyces tanzawaensis NRRL Y-17324]ODV82308.1 hypothetical protein CANTADRAFT_4319 [Suhomyces tanzawaensis NRRL Y-17324]